MIKDYKIVTLCGSTRFKEQFLETQKRLTLEGYIVISVGLFGHSGDDEVWKPGTKEMLDDMHLRKIDLADEIVLLNSGQVERKGTKEEMADQLGFTPVALSNPDCALIPREEMRS